MKKIYLAHPRVTETHGGFFLFKLLLEKEFPEWQFVNPFHSPLTEEWYKSPTLETAIKIIKKDLELIDECDIVLAYLPDMTFEDEQNASIGTAMEIFYTNYVLHKTVFALTPFNHPWLLNFVDVICRNIEDLKTKLRKYDEK